MKRIKLESVHNNNFRFVIKEDKPEVGAYLFVYNEKGEDIRDDLQDTIEICKEVALEEYGG